jgi:hypothetical protein
MRRAPRYYAMGTGQDRRYLCVLQRAESGQRSARVDFAVSHGAA